VLDDTSWVGEQVIWGQQRTADGSNGEIQRKGKWLP